MTNNAFDEFVKTYKFDFDKMTVLEHSEFMPVLMRMHLGDASVETQYFLFIGKYLLGDDIHDIPAIDKYKLMADFQEAYIEYFNDRE